MLKMSALCKIYESMILTVCVEKFFEKNLFLFAMKAARFPRNCFVAAPTGRASPLLAASFQERPYSPYNKYCRVSRALHLHETWAVRNTG